MLEIPFHADRVLRTRKMYQWDHGQWLSVSGFASDDAVLMQFTLDDNKQDPRLAVVKNGRVYAQIPKAMFEKDTEIDYEIIMYLYVTSKRFGKTVCKVTIVARCKRKSY